MTAPDQPVSPHDARAVANLLLKLAQAKGLSVTNLSLQKLIYFAHGLMLRRHGRPLVDGYFEAWDYGPVHPLLYSCFKTAGRSPIAHPALKRDLRRGLLGPVEMDADAEAEGVVSEVLDALGHQPAGRLVRISHANTDFRRGAGYSPEGRRFAISVAHQRIRMLGADFTDIELGILSFPAHKNRPRSVRLWVPEIELFTFDQLSEMTVETLNIWDTVCNEKAALDRRQAAAANDDGPLFRKGRLASLEG